MDLSEFPTRSFLTISLIILVVLLVRYYFSWSYSYWKRNGVPYLEPSRPFGNLKELFLQRQCFGEVLSNIYFELKSKKYKYGGYFTITKPMFCPVDHHLIKLILQKDFQYFSDRGIHHDEDIEPLSANLFAINGSQWHRLRKIFTPTFTSGKMKMMFFTIIECSKELEKVIDHANGRINIKDISARFTTDVIASCAFGIKCNSLKNPGVDFFGYGQKILNFTSIQFLKGLLIMAMPKVMKCFRLTIFNSEATNFFLKILKETVEYREKNQVQRNDFMNLLIQLKNHGEGKKKISFKQLAAQAFIFFAAGFETSSSTITFCFYELVRNLEVQEKLREEIWKVFGDGDISYEGIMKMTYMDTVILETLRMYPVLPMLFRECTRNYKIPDGNVTIKKGTKILIPVFGLHRDEEFYPKPDCFDPERFNDENKKKIPNFVYLPFGEGPRNCIGMRFGMIQTKIGLTTLLRNHKYLIDPLSPISPKMDPQSFMLSIKDKIILKCIRIKN